MPPAVVGRGPQGPDIDDPEKRGIIPRIVEHIFQKIRSAPQYVEFTVLVSYMEIYCERINDLLDRTWDAPYAAASPGTTSLTRDSSPKGGGNHWLWC